MPIRSCNTFLAPLTEGTMVPAYLVQRGEEPLEAHQHVRRASKIHNVHYWVEPQVPPDVLGIYIHLTKGKLYGIHSLSH